jgi:TatD DNase family protein
MIDAHCHIDLYPRPTEVAFRADRARVLTVMVTNLPSAFEKAFPHVQAFGQIRIALGLHPLLAREHIREREPFRRLIDKTSYIGEVGLDFSREGFDTKDLQLDSFRFVLNALDNKPKFITVHSRRAESAVLDVMEESGYPFPVVFHWFSGPLNVLDRAAQKGHFFSINTAMTESPNGQKIIDRIPPGRTLTETDGPFVKIGGRVVEPSDVQRVERYLASSWSISGVDVRAKVKENFLKIVRPIKIIKK